MLLVFAVGTAVGTKCDGESIRGGLIVFCHLTLRKVRFIVTFLFARNITFSEKKKHVMGDTILSCSVQHKTKA
jgi:hypothetical protein